MPIAPTSPADLPKLRVMDVFDRAARTHGPKPALRVRRNNGWRTLTWSEYHQQVRMAARALITLGVKPGAGVCLIGYNSPEWFVADVASIYAGAIPAG
ncbi:MAG TPA: AMP-binding protein, partial [Gemmatimonadaceae bacterium]